MAGEISRRGFLAAAAGAGVRRGRRPNIVFLLSDDQRWDTLGCMGNGVIRTPNIDRLASQGAVFHNNFCATAICCTSRASIFTGLLERSHGISDFSTDLAPRVWAQSYPALLRQAGYRTGFVGKFGVGTHLPESTFDYWRGLPGQAGVYLREHNGRRMHLTRIFEEQSLEFLRGCGPGQPFCLSVSFKAPHAEDDNPLQYIYDPALKDLYRDAVIPVPKTANEAEFDKLPEFVKRSEARVRWGWRFTTPERYQEMVKGYYRLISGVDDAVGSVVAALEKAGMRDDTVILYTSDNGYFLGEHGLADKWFMHEESIRTPLVVAGPGVKRGAVREEMTLNIDLAATMLGMAGVRRPGSMQGRDLGGLLAGRKTAWRREWYYSHRFRHARIPPSEGVRQADRAYWRWSGQTPVVEELYDLRRDAGEQRNLASTDGAAMEEMRGRWRAWDRALSEWRVEEAWREPAM